jgi:hypothetical protein
VKYVFYEEGYKNYKELLDFEKVVINFNSYKTKYFETVDDCVNYKHIYNSEKYKDFTLLYVCNYTNNVPMWFIKEIPPIGNVLTCFPVKTVTPYFKSFITKEDCICYIDKLNYIKNFKPKYYNI